MSLFSKLFNGKNPIDEKFKEIKILEVTMRQRDAQEQSRLMINNLIQNPSQINGMKMYEELGNHLTNELNNFQRADELQFITELAFFLISKRLNEGLHPFNLYDRLIILYNAEDFLEDTIMDANDLNYAPLSRVNSMHSIKWQVEAILLKMRYFDLFHENRCHRPGSNDNTFNGQEFIKITRMIENGQFSTTNKNEIVKEGGELIQKCYEFIATKYSLKI